jgi:hypothetical protein
LANIVEMSVKVLQFYTGIGIDDAKTIHVEYYQFFWHNLGKHSFFLSINNGNT